MSYDDAIPTKKDEVRLLIGDKDEDNEFLTDGEIYYHLRDNNDAVLEAAVDAAESIAAELAPEVNYQASTLRQEAAQAFEHFQQIAERLRRRAQRGLGLPEFVHSGDDERAPEFYMAMHDNRVQTRDEDDFEPRRDDAEDSHTHVT